MLLVGNIKNSTVLLLPALALLSILTGDLAATAVIVAMVAQGVWCYYFSWRSKPSPPLLK